MTATENQRRAGHPPWGAPQARQVRFAVLTSDGRLVIRSAPGRAYDTQWGLYQDDLWAAVRAGVDPHGGDLNGIELHASMRAKLADAAMAGTAPARYPPNLVASVVLATLGQPPRAWYGAVAIVGTEDQQGLTTSLTGPQLELIHRAYRLATDTAP
jgi:hypothetical protein